MARRMVFLSSDLAAQLFANVAAAAVRDDPQLTSNWAGYAVTGGASAPLSFSGVSAIWKEPAATCTSGEATSSAFWVGLGGLSQSSQALEQIGTSAAVAGTAVKVQIRNLTRKTRFSKTLRANALDVSSAEWVAEAPSACNQRGRCAVLPLTDFGTVPFANASATANGHTGSIVDGGWTATPLELVPNARRFEAATAPSALSPDGTVFSVSSQMA